ncbi:uncharacterized protein Z518_08290 [Rhinocladiella mackenziei CBS 650.93]|uniref:Uncharacterized protein n=1 Tax=Rhinocladiella mackenziei CBS 650.93 TaxID=1442369 RepID=A0A0D2I935_9EURO|nr:uncharacterized protein Z518_08290 [Rhinocladiella mackenziei CBS 650.93]KIX02349.1 hypothetical protein Z518_08290 [Rhinocladiella mackenziei CBS 650.93]
MADVYTSFPFNSPPHKRKRRPDDLTDSFCAHDAKRRSTHCLPIRSSPSRPQVSVLPQYSLFTSIYQQPPTPVDTSDDESPGQPKDEDHWPHKVSSMNDSQPGSDCRSTSSLRARREDPIDVDMDMSTNSPQPRIRRARSNDIVPPHRNSNFLSAMDNFARERVPTPISSHFDNRVNDLPSVPRHQFPPLRTNLSPMFEQESWVNRDGLPSPVDDQDMDSMMMIDPTNDDISGLGVNGDDSTHVRSTGPYGSRAEGTSSPGRSRTARLHMGFLNDCEKCAQKVPGHYSHIMWS